MDDRTIALYGVILGSIGTIISVILAVNELAKKKRALLVSYKFGTKTGAMFSENQAVFVKVLNNGPRPVEVADIGFSTKNNHFLGFRKSAEKIELPKKLEFGDSITGTFLFATLSEEIYMKNDSIKNVIVVDGENRKYKKRLRLSPEEYVEIIK